MPLVPFFNSIDYDNDSTEYHIMIVPFPIGNNNGKGEIKLDQLNKPLLQGLCPAGGLGGLAAVG